MEENNITAEQQNINFNKMNSDSAEHKRAKITVVGVGGGGCNAAFNMLKRNIEGISLVAMNTDAQSFDRYKEVSELKFRRMVIGKESVTRGLGAGSDPAVGGQAANESRAEIDRVIDGTDLLFIAAGMGGGTGTGAAPVVAQLAREKGILTVAVVTKPFWFEGEERMRTAEKGVEELSKYVDTLIIIPNEKLNVLLMESDKGKMMTLADAYQKVDDVLSDAVQSITDMITQTGYQNLDFADINTALRGKGYAHIGMGSAEGTNRVDAAFQQAVCNPLLEENIEGATYLIVCVAGGRDFTFQEMSRAGEICKGLTKNAITPAKVKVGTVINEKIKGIKITVVATGFPESNTVGEMGKTSGNTAAKLGNLFKTLNDAQKPSTAAPTQSIPRNTAPAPQQPVQKPAVTPHENAAPAPQTQRPAAPQYNGYNSQFAAKHDAGYQRPATEQRPTYPAQSSTTYPTTNPSDVQNVVRSNNNPTVKSGIAAVLQKLKRHDDNN